MRKPLKYLAFITGGILLIPALLINLDAVNIFMGVDEATRALPAMEMIINGNYVTPTILGDFYYNKPPLFNWISAGLFSLFGYSEFILRLPTVLSFIGFGYSIYFFVSKEYGKYTGALTAFMFLTFGRLLFWETYLGYIDTTFSWVVYLSFMSIIYFYKREKMLQLFLVSWILIAIAFMLKGLPAIVFQGLTLAGFFIVERKFLKLFSWQSIVGGLSFIIICGTYYLVYSQYNSLENVFSTLWAQSSKRTVADVSWIRSVKHFWKFPQEVFYHFLPGTLLVIFLFGTRLFKCLKNDAFLRFNFWVFVINIPIYWASPDFYPKYIMALMPLILTVMVKSYLDDLGKDGIRSKIANWFFFGITALFTLAFPASNFFPQLNHPKMSILITLLLFAVAAFATWKSWVNKKQSLAWLTVILILGRIFFDIYVWPLRVNEFTKFEEEAKQVAKIVKDKGVQIYKKESWAYGTYLHITLETGKIVSNENNDPKPDSFYITGEYGEQDLTKRGTEFETLLEFTDPQDKKPIKLIKTKSK